MLKIRFLKINQLSIPLMFKLRFSVLCILFALFCLNILGISKLQAQTQSQFRLTPHSKKEKINKKDDSSKEINYLIKVLKDDKQRKKLIDRLESTRTSRTKDKKTESLRNSKESFSFEALINNSRQKINNFLGAVGKIFSSPLALFILITKLTLSIILIIVAYLLWRVIKYYILPRVRSIRLLKIFTSVVFGLITGAAILGVWGVDIYLLLTTEPGKSIIESLITILFVLVLAYIIWEIINRVIHSHIEVINFNEEWNKRLQTVLPLIRSTLLIVICGITILIVFAELGINIAPLLAGAGILGLAIGFGSQALIKDILTGIFVLSENTINVGDWVILGGHDGQVEGVKIRNVLIRDIHGNLHTIRWSSVVSITNQTRDYGYAVVEIGVAYRENIDEIIFVAKQIAEEMRKDTTINKGILSELQILGLIELGDSAVVVRTRLKTLPFYRWRIEREFRKRIKNRFDELGIEIPYPHQTIYFGQDKNGEAPPARLHLTKNQSSNQN